MKTRLSILLFLLFPLAVFGQETAAAEPSSFWSDPLNDPLFPLYAVTTLLFIVILLVLFVAAYLVRVLNMMANQAAKEKAERLGLVYKPQPSLWNRM
jgi:hypothetical protein